MGHFDLNFLSAFRYCVNLKTRMLWLNIDRHVCLYACTARLHMDVAFKTFSRAQHDADEVNLLNDSGYSGLFFCSKFQIGISFISLKK